MILLLIIETKHSPANLERKSRGNNLNAMTIHNIIVNLVQEKIVQETSIKYRL